MNIKIRKSIVPPTWTDKVTTSIITVLIPVIYYFEFSVVLPDVYPRGTTAYWFNLILGNFMAANIIGNYICMLLCDTSVQAYSDFGKIKKSDVMERWSSCNICNENVPPRAWHCIPCATCILKRDHHCIFIGYCIGEHNRRFFTMFLYHMLLGCSYASYCTSLFIWKRLDISLPSFIVQLLFPPLVLVLGPKGILNTMYLLLYVVLVVTTAMTCLLTVCNTSLILRGLLAFEAKRQDKTARDKNIVENFKEVLGARWYLTWISPLIASELSSMQE